MNNTQSYAILDINGKVINFCLWDGDLNNWQPPENTTAILTSELPENWQSVNSVTEKLFSAEEWLNAQGYSSIRLVTLLDLENKLKELNKSSQKLTDIRTWIDFILLSFIQNNEPKNDWQPAPHLFEDTVQDVFNVLNS
jgi:hypothetical protein